MRGLIKLQRLHLYENENGCRRCRQNAYSFVIIADIAATVEYQGNQCVLGFCCTHRQEQYESLRSESNTMDRLLLNGRYDVHIHIAFTPSADVWVCIKYKRHFEQ